MARHPWNEDALTMTLWRLSPTYLPQLDHLSIFIQGPLNRRGAYQSAIADLRRLHAPNSPPPLKSFIVRFPHQQVLNTAAEIHHQGIDKLLADPSLPFKVMRPTPSCQGTVADDMDVGVDVGWRYGVLFLASKAEDGTSEPTMMNYLVWTPVPKGGKWPYTVPS